MDRIDFRALEKVATAEEIVLNVNHHDGWAIRAIEGSAPSLISSKKERLRITVPVDAVAFELIFVDPNVSWARKISLMVLGLFLLAVTGTLKLKLLRW